MELRLVSSDLTVVVTHRGKPIAGIEVKVVPEKSTEPVFPGVDITLKNAFSGDEYRTVSDSTGAFLIPEVPDGVYMLTIAGGMKSLTGMAGTLAIR